MCLCRGVHVKPVGVSSGCSGLMGWLLTWLHTYPVSGALMGYRAGPPLAPVELPVAHPAALQWPPPSFASQRWPCFSQEAQGQLCVSGQGPGHPGYIPSQTFWPVSSSALPTLLHLVKCFLSFGAGKLGRDLEFVLPGSLCWAGGLLADLGSLLRLRPCIAVNLVDTSLRAPGSKAECTGAEGQLG